MIGPGEIIPQRLRAGAAQEDGTGVLNGIQVGEGVVHLQFQVLRGDLVGNFDARHERFRHNDLAVIFNGSPGDFLPGKQRQLPLQLRLDGQSQLFAVRYQHGACQLVVLGLAEKVCRHMDGVTLAVGNDQNFTGPRDHVDGHPAEDLLLGLRHEGVARAYDFIHPGNAFRAVGQGGNGLGAAYLKNPIHPGNRSRRQNGGVHLPVPAGGRNHHQLGTAGNFRGDGVHQHRGGVGRRAAGNIDPHLFNGGDFLTQDDAGLIGDDEGISHLAAVESADIFRRFPENV